MKMLLLLFVLVGCASGDYAVDDRDSYTIAVDSISGPASSLRNFTIVSGMSDVKDSDLRFQEFANVASKALELEGFSPSAKPDVKIVLTYSVSDPRTHSETSSVPVYGTKTTNFSNSFGQNLGSAQSFGQTGTVEDVETITNYTRTVVLKAYNAKTNAQLWETSVTSSGRSGDLRKLFPYLVATGAKHFGTTTAGKQVSIVWEDDARVSALRKPASP